MNKALPFLLAGFIFYANAGFAQIQPKTQNGITYLSGGVGLDERSEMKASMHGYNLIMTFAEKSGAYVADVKVSIKSLGGKQGLEAVSDGPLFYAALPPGRYRVSAEYAGKTQTKIVKLGKANQVFRWQ